MTADEIRIVVAKELGYIECDKMWSPLGAFGCIKPDCGHDKCYPAGMCAHYESYLDACDNILEWLRTHKYSIQITTVGGHWSVCILDSGVLLLGADNGKLPLAICEAFLRLRGKWKEDK